MKTYSYIYFYALQWLGRAGSCYSAANILWAFYNIIPCNTLLYYTVLYYAMLYYCTMLCYNVLYILHYTFLYYAYCTVLYHTILYYTILVYAQYIRKWSRCKGNLSCPPHSCCTLPYNVTLIKVLLHVWGSLGSIMLAVLQQWNSTTLAFP
jgi:hypothetical protein